MASGYSLTWWSCTDRWFYRLRVRMCSRVDDCAGCEYVFCVTGSHHRCYSANRTRNQNHKRRHTTTETASGSARVSLASCAMNIIEIRWIQGARRAGCGHTRIHRIVCNFVYSFSEIFNHQLLPIYKRYIITCCFRFVLCVYRIILFRYICVSYTRESSTRRCNIISVARMHAARLQLRKYCFVKMLKINSQWHFNRMVLFAAPVH